MKKIPKTAESSPGKPELLAPAGNLEKCKIAFLYGADAVYVGGKNYSLRASSRNLNREELAHACCLAHSLGKKLYVTVNVFAREADFQGLPEFLSYLEDIKVDGLIVSDPGVLLLTRQWAPTLPLHLSTQANTTNSLSVFFWQKQGVRRINLARELRLEELQRIRQNTALELEIFVHGALCVAYSGRCLLSAFLNQRSSNMGLCTQPCRWDYRLVEAKRPGQYFSIQEDNRGTYILNSKDLCLMGSLGQLMSLGLDAFKVEGRMKGALYLASVLRSYRRAIDKYWEHPEDFMVEEAWEKDLQQVSHRPYTSGLLLGGLQATQEFTSSAPYIRSHTLAGLVRRLPPEMQTATPTPVGGDPAGWIVVEARSRLVPGMELEFLHPNGSTLIHTLQAFHNLQGQPLMVAHANTWIRFPVPFGTFPLQVIRTSVETVSRASQKAAPTSQHAPRSPFFTANR
jgi:U32 family peptidase